MYKLLLVLGVPMAVTVPASAQPSNNGPLSDIGFSSVAAALEATRAKSGVQVSVQGGWTVIEDRTAASIWSFAPPGHAAYPAAVRRTIIQQGNDIFIRMAVLCEAAKSACDQLVAEFEELNKKMRESLSRRRGP